MTVVRAALVQQSWAGSKDAMIDNAALAIAQAAAQGAQAICLQELSTVRTSATSRTTPCSTTPSRSRTGPQRRPCRSSRAATGLSSLPRCTSETAKPSTTPPRSSTLTVRCSGSTARTTSRTPRGTWRSSTSARVMWDIRCSTPPVGKVGVYICYDRHFPEGWRALGLAGAQIVFNPSGTSRSLSHYVWRMTQPAAAVANSFFIGAFNRVGHEGPNDFYGQSYFVDPNGSVLGEQAPDTAEALVIRDRDLSLIVETREHWAFYRDRRPDSYQPLVQG